MLPTPVCPGPRTSCCYPKPRNDHWAHLSRPSHDDLTSLPAPPTNAHAPDRMIRPAQESRFHGSSVYVLRISLVYLQIDKLEDMSNPRVISLFSKSDPHRSWNEGMSEGEFAVLFANSRPADLDPAIGPVAVIHSSLVDAVTYAQAETIKDTHLRCSIYDEVGLGKPPLRVIAGLRGADTTFLSAKFRLWGGGICLGAGVALGAAEALSGMTLNWAGMLAARIGPAGAILLLTEVGVRLSDRKKKQT